MKYFFIATAIYGISIGINLTSLPLYLNLLGYSKSEVASILIFEIIAIFFAAPYLRIVISRFNLFNTIIYSLLIRNIFLFFLSKVASKFWIIFTIFDFGAGGYILFVSFQIWMNHITDETNRATNFGKLNACYAFGIACGPIILNIFSIHSMMAIKISAAISMFMLIPISRLKIDTPIINQNHHINFQSLMRSVKIPILCGFIVDFTFFAFGDFIVIYGLSQGLSITEARMLISYLIVSGILLDIPIGKLIDNFDRYKMIIIFSIIGIFTFQLIPYVIHSTILTILLFAVMSGAISGIYISGISMLGDKFKGDELIAASSALSIMNASGALCGISLTGIAIDLYGDHGLVISLSITYLIFLLMIIYFKKK